MTALDYETIEHVADGGSGSVYRAKLSDGRLAAVKRLAPKYADQRLLDEAQMLASLDHRNIVQFYGVQQGKDESLDLVMEWVGPSLAQVMECRGVGLSTTIFMVRELLEALAYLDDKDKVHRDISPRNVLLGSDGAVKLADFGLARRTAAPRTTEVLRGSPPYMSPEQIHGQKLDGRSDLFAVGVLMYQLITGELPYATSDDIADNAPVTPVQVLRPDAPDELCAIVSRLLQFNRNDRYQSAAEVIAALPEQSRLEEAAARADLAALVRETAEAIAIAQEPDTGAESENQKHAKTASPGRRFTGFAAVAGMAAGILVAIGGMYLYGGSDFRGTGVTQSAETASHDVVPGVTEERHSHGITLERSQADDGVQTVKHDVAPAKPDDQDDSSPERLATPARENNMSQRRGQPARPRPVSRKEPTAESLAAPKAVETTTTPRSHREVQRHDLGLGEMVSHKSHGEAVFHDDERAKTTPSAVRKGEKR